jgi:hypothetical protein
MRFVTAIGVVCRILALKLNWSSVADEILLSPIRNWEPRIRRSWEGWVLQFIRIVTCWFDDAISPNNILRELSLARLTAPDTPLVALGGESVLFEGLTEMLDSFARFVQSTVKSMENRRYWGIDVLRACILLLGDGINFEFIEGAFSPALDEEIDEEEAQMLLDALEAAQPQLETDEESSDGEGVEEEEEDTFRLRYGGDQDDDDDDDDIPYLIFPTRRGRVSERNVAKDVPIVSHRKAYSGHSNVETVPPSSNNSNCQIKDVNYYGLDDEYVMSGSDDGILFIC